MIPNLISKEKFEQISLAVQNDDPVAKYLMGNCFLNGIHVQQDNMRAHAMFMISGNQEFAPSQNACGFMHLQEQMIRFFRERSGPDEDQDLEADCRRAWQWLIRAAHRNDPSGLYNLAGMYRFGVYADKDEDIAASLYRMAYRTDYMAERSRIALEKMGADLDMTDEDQARLEKLFEYEYGWDRGAVPEVNADYASEIEALKTEFIIDDERLIAVRDELETLRKEKYKPRYFLYLKKHLVKEDTATGKFYRFEDKDGKREWAEDFDLENKYYISIRSDIDYGFEEIDSETADAFMQQDPA